MHGDCWDGVGPEGWRFGEYRRVSVRHGTGPELGEDSVLSCIPDDVVYRCLSDTNDDRHNYVGGGKDYRTIERAKFSSARHDLASCCNVRVPSAVGKNSRAWSCVAKAVSRVACTASDPRAD